MRWVIGSIPTSLPVSGHMRESIELGVGRLNKLSEFDEAKDYPVYIDEPLMVLALSSRFQKRDPEIRKNWLHRALSIAPNSQARGYLFEDMLLLVLMDRFGGRFTALSDVFKFDESDSKLASRKVTLVALQQTPGQLLLCNQVSFKSGASDRFGLKAQSPKDILDFLENPHGKPFLFPDVHMGPDLMCFFQEEETGEVVASAFQAKTSKELSSTTWLKAVQSVTPTYFYMMKVLCLGSTYAQHFYTDAGWK
jgi:hypothetical protein